LTDIYHLSSVYKHLPFHTRAPRIYLSMTPTVEYDSREQLVSAIYRGRKEYGAMLGRVVDERLALNESVLNEASLEQLEAERGTEVRTMVSSISCAEMCGEGVEILLRVTQGRGKWWAVAVNEAVIDAVERPFTCVGVVKRDQTVMVSNNTSIVWRRGGRRAVTPGAAHGCPLRVRVWFRGTTTHVDVRPGMSVRTCIHVHVYMRVGMYVRRCVCVCAQVCICVGA